MLLTEIVKIYYLDGQNAAEASCLSLKSQRLWRGPYPAHVVRDVMYKSEESVYTRDRSPLVDVLSFQLKLQKGTSYGHGT
ncbi:hypothetical protein TNCT_117651 [Trichonephila clavata]|uniref:Uncharacterized protein n=1 Tax=Trichonephila clavata TaxID=2740835 RepID=A0A8X6HKW0_TRICU|nr:hypothetical protein TNCT_117651 [Trichonephila clavata]